MQQWSLKYRPHKFSELALDDVRTQMARFQRDNNFPRTLLFTGPKGTGKTSTSRIIAAILNSPANRESVEKYYLQGSDDTPRPPLADPETNDSQVAQILQGQRSFYALFGYLASLFLPIFHRLASSL